MPTADLASFRSVWLSTQGREVEEGGELEVEAGEV
jgi:hypothetical protein